MDIRSGQETAERVVSEMITRAPTGSTGFYVTSAGIAFGYRTNRDKAPENYVWFKDSSQAPYNQRITGTHVLANDEFSDHTIILEMNERQAHVLYRALQHVGGPPAGPRAALLSVSYGIYTAFGGWCDSRNVLSNDGDIEFYMGDGPRSSIYLKDKGDA